MVDWITVRAPTQRLDRLTRVCCLLVFFFFGSASIADKAALGSEFEASKPSSRDFAIWGKPTSGIIAENDVRYGRLPNGLRYAVMRNKPGEHRVVFRMRINGGHLSEQAREQGLAHLLEHMAFRGSTNVPEGELRLIAARFGLSLGGDASAITSWEDTSYSLAAADNQPKTTATMLMLLREIASNLTLDQAAIDRERPVVLNEIRMRMIQDQRWIRYVHAIAPGSPLASLLEGDGKDVARATAGTLQVLYRRLYRPEDTELVVVGDVDPAAIETAIVQRFGDWRPHGPSGSVDWSGFKSHTKESVTYDVDPARPESITLAVTTPYKQPVVDRPLYRRAVIEGVLNIGIMARFSHAVLEGAPISGGGGGITDVERSHRIAQVFVTPRPGEWQEALEYVENEKRRLALSGLTSNEFEAAKAELIHSYDAAADAGAQRDNSELSQIIAGSAISGDPLTSDPYNKELALQDLATLSLTEANTYWRAYWNKAPVQTRLELATPIQGSTPLGVISAVITKTAESSSSVVVARRVTFAYPLQEAGKLVADQTDQDGIRRIVFSNGVRLNVKHTLFKPGSAAITVNLGNGQEDIVGDHCVRVLGAAMLSYGGTGRQSVAQLQDALSGSAVTIPFFTIAPNRIVYNADVTAASISLTARLVSAYIADPGFRSEAETLARRDITEQMRQRRSNPDMMLVTDGLANAEGNDERSLPVDQSCLDHPSIGSAAASLRHILKTGAIEIGVVGDLPDSVVVNTIATSFGALPVRTGTFAPDWSAQMALSLDRAPTILHHEGNVELATTGLVWPAGDDRDLRASAARSLLAALLNDRIFAVVREQSGLSYNLGAQAYSSPFYRNFGYVFAFAGSSITEASGVETAILSIAKKLASDRVDPDALNRVRLTIENQLQEGLETNGGWIGAVGSVQSSPQTVDRLTSRRRALDEIKDTDIQVEARRIFEQTPVTIRVLPSLRKQAR